MAHPPHMDSALERFHDVPRVASRLGHFLTDQMHYEPAKVANHFQLRHDAGRQMTNLECEQYAEASAYGDTATCHRLAALANARTRPPLTSIQPAVGVGYTERLQHTTLSDERLQDMHTIASRNGSVEGARQVEALSPYTRFPLPQLSLDGHGRRV